MRDLYEILGVDKNCNKAELKSAYRKLAKKYHPDVNPNNKEAEENFKEVNFAYEILSDDNRRQKYDTYGAVSYTHLDVYKRQLVCSLVFKTSIRSL